MDLFKDCMSKTIDLDDLDVYSQEWKAMSIHELFLKCMKDAGASLFHMDFLHKDVSYGEQRKRVVILCEELSNLWHYTRQFEPDADKSVVANEREYKLCLLKWRYRFQDETENQC